MDEKQIKDLIKETKLTRDSLPYEQKFSQRDLMDIKIITLEEVLRG